MSRWECPGARSRRARKEVGPLRLPVCGNTGRCPRAKSTALSEKQPGFWPSFLTRARPFSGLPNAIPDTMEPEVWMFRPSPVDLVDELVVNNRPPLTGC